MKRFLAEYLEHLAGYAAGIILGAFLIALALFAIGCSKDPGVPVECHCAKCEACK